MFMQSQASITLAKSHRKTGEQINEQSVRSANKKDGAGTQAVRSLPSARMCIQHNQSRHGADSHASADSNRDYASGRKYRIFGRPRHWFARLYLPAHEHRRHFLDVNSARPEATLFLTFFGQPVQIITHFTSVNANPMEFCFRYRSVATQPGRVPSIAARCGQQ